MMTGNCSTEKTKSIVDNESASKKSLWHKMATSKYLRYLKLINQWYTKSVWKTRTTSPKTQMGKDYQNQGWN